MKKYCFKIHVLILLIWLCVYLFAFSLYAEKGSIPLSKSDAIATVKKACEVTEMMIDGQGVFAADNHQSMDLKDIDVIPEKDWPYYSLINPQKLPGGSLQGFREYLKTIYTEPLAEDYYSTGYLFNDLPMFAVDKNDNTFIVWNYPMEPRVDFTSSDNIKVDFVDYNGNTVTARVCMLINIGDNVQGFKWINAWIECKFENTDVGWKISKCELFDILNSYKRNFEWTPVESPSTGDTAGERVAVIGAVSLACIIPTACLMRRRRRRDTI